MNHLLDLLQHYGLAFVFINVLALQAGLPFPAYPTLIVTGALASRGGYSLPALVATAVLASLIADLAWYSAGRRLGGRVLRTLCRVSLSPDSCVRQTESIFQRWGASSLLVAKFVPGLASVATAMSGVVRIPLWRFVPADAVGAALWSGLAIFLGYVFRDAIDDVLNVLQALGKAGLMIIVTGFVLYVLWKWWQRVRFIRQLVMDRVTVNEVNKLIEDGRMGTVIDVRSPMSQALTGRIPGAISVDADNLKLGVLALTPESEVVVYCACPNEATAVKVAKMLVQHGFKRVRPLQGGIDAWIEAGFAVEH
jgi:membrane protein DedA with SNARE-associated domain/rhodanese-related sulfurtransferase